MKKHKIAARVPFLVLLLAVASRGQSLGDVARQQRQKQQAKDPHATHKVVTNEEIPESPDASTSTSDDPDRSEEPSSPPVAAGGKKTAEQWKAQIQAQKARIAALQDHVNKLSDSVHFVEANRYYNGVQYNQYQLKKQQEAQRLQKQLDGEKKTLENMQESARKAGFGSAVYDP
jgi:predicted RNase H-like nuclease (RuvC/YqgF family)